MTDSLASTVQANTFSPKFDVKEDEHAYTLEGELPGLEQKDVSIEFSDDQTLSIRGRTESVREEGQRPDAANVTDVTSSEGGGAQNDSEAKTAETKDMTTTNNSKEVSHPTPQKQTYWLSERSVGEFARSFSFPVRVDQENVKASLKNGILSVVLPKVKAREREGARKIAIE